MITDAKRILQPHVKVTSFVYCVYKSYTSIATVSLKTCFTSMTVLDGLFNLITSNSHKVS